VTGDASFNKHEAHTGAAREAAKVAGGVGWAGNGASSIEPSNAAVRKERNHEKGL
jgi:hypothetical protein